MVRALGFAVFLGLGVWGCPAAVRAQEAGAVLLRNGQFLEGIVRVDGDRYVVYLASGEVRIPRDNVEMLGANRAAIYREMRARRPAQTAEAALRWCDWCLRQGLLNEAHEELREASQLAPADPRLQGLRVRWELASAPPATSDQGAASDRDGSQSVTPSPPQHVADSTTAEQTSRRSDPPQANRAASPAPNLLALEGFAREIQPLLLNGCAASRCHGGRGATDFELLRPSRSAPLTRKITDRNLAAVTRQIDPSAPHRSPLLTYARSAHGGDEKPSLAVEGADGRYARLAAWVESVVAPAELPATIPQPRRLGAPAGDVVPASAELPVDDSVEPAPATVETPEAPEASELDPYDPAPFNRRYHGKQ